MRKITKIESNELTPIKRKRVAAYARVSTGHEEQLHSLSAQISYYNSYIGSRGDWELIGIYADAAQTGTRDDRPEFQRLMKDVRAHRIDMVIVKSITRLARNTVTLLRTVREFRRLMVDIYFERERIHTLSSDGELMLTLLASFAQEESRSVSENVKWRIRKNFEAGIPTGNSLLGYRFKDGMLEVVPEEAKIVKQIFNDYLSGMGRGAIAKKLNRMGIPTKQGNPWEVNSLHYILRNEKYTGNLILQKSYRIDHINKRDAKNRGELPMYYVEDSHEAIIDQETFDRVQRELDLRAEKFHRPNTGCESHPMIGFLRCGICGRRYRRRIIHANGKYRKAAWICPTFDNCGKAVCPSQQIPEDILVNKTLEVLGIADLSREILQQQIKEIQVPQHNTLVYVFQDGNTEEVHWQNHSRRESWTKEMKQQAREHKLKTIEKNRKEEDSNANT